MSKDEQKTPDKITDALAAAGLRDEDKRALADIESTIVNCELALGGTEARVAKAFVMAKGIAQLRRLITDAMMAEHIMPLMNTRLGFKTDKDPNRPSKGERPTPYPLPVVKDCLIEALMRGAYPVNNEFNIIASQAYLTKEFFERKVGELPGVTNVVPSPGVPRVENGRTLIRFALSWRKDGNSDCLKDAEGKPGRVFEIRTDAYSSADQVVGKATRKAYAAAYKQITGSVMLPDGEADDLPPVVEGSATGAPGAATAPRPGGVQRVKSRVVGEKGAVTPPASAPPPDEQQQQQDPEQGDGQQSGTDAGGDAETNGAAGGPGQGEDLRSTGQAATSDVPVAELVGTVEKWRDAMEGVYAGGDMTPTDVGRLITKVEVGYPVKEPSRRGQKAREQTYGAARGGLIDVKTGKIIEA